MATLTEGNTYSQSVAGDQTVAISIPHNTIGKIRFVPANSEAITSDMGVGTSFGPMPLSKTFGPWGQAGTVVIICEVGTITYTVNASTFPNNPVLSAGTANRVQYLNASKVLSDSAIFHDGTNVGLNVAPSAWNTFNASEIGSPGVGVYGYIGYSHVGLTMNAYYNGGWKYAQSSRVSGRYEIDGSGVHGWYIAGSGTAGNAITFTQAMTLDAGADLMVGTTTNPASARLAVYNPSGEIARFGSPNATSSYITVGRYDVTGEGVTLGYNSSTGDCTLTAVASSHPIIFKQGTTERARIDSSGHFTPGADNTQTMGSSSKRWSVVYAGTGTINTSDAREKTEVTLLGANEIAAAKQLVAEIGTFKFLDAIAAKGDAARKHVGMTVQRAIEIMESNGLDPMAYGFICHDTWGDQFEEVADPEGLLTRTVERQATVAQTVTESKVEVTDGVARLVTTTKTVDVPQFNTVNVVDENDNVVMIEIPAELDEEGNVVTPASSVPMTHQVPIMETVTERYTRNLVRAAGDCYGFRADELLLFIARGLK